MSDEQQGPDLTKWAKSLDARRAELRDEEAEFEQAVQVRDRIKLGEYRRANPMKFPTSEAGQLAAAEGTAAAEGFTVVSSIALSRSIKRAAQSKRLEIDQPAADVLRAKMFELIEEHERDTTRRRAQDEAAHGLTGLARRYADAKSYEERDAIVERYGERLSLPEAGLIRRAAKVMERALPDLIVEAHAGGQAAPEIARELGCTPRHAYQVIRDNPWDAHWALYRAGDDRQWERVTAGHERTSETAEDCAKRILAEQATDPTLSRQITRVSVWFDTATDDPGDALAEASRMGDTPLDH